MLKKISKGKYNVPHFTQKGEVGEYALQQLPTTLIGPSFYYHNFLQLLSPKREKDGTLVYNLPNLKMFPAFDVDEIGEVIVSIENCRDEWIGKTVPLIGEMMPIQRYIDQMADFTNQQIKLNPITCVRVCQRKH